MKLTIFGGSVAMGLGVKDRSFSAIVAERLSLELLNLANSAAQVADSLEMADRATGSEVVLVMHGSTEAIVRPTDRSLRFLPPRWRRRGWMDPRAYYSSKLHKRIPQRIESALRWRVKVALIRIIGGQSIVGLDEYAQLTRELIARLRELDVGRVVFVGSAGIATKYYPGSVDEIAEYDRATEQIARENGALFVDILDACDRWDDYFLDHTHPNANGHAKIAELILTRMEKTAPATAGVSVS